MAAARAAWAATLAALAVAIAVRWAAFAACWLVLILAFAVVSAVLIDLVVVFTVPLAADEVCLMVFRLRSTVLMPFCPRSSVLMVLRSWRTALAGSETVSATCRPLQRAGCPVCCAARFDPCFLGCSAAAFRFWATRVMAKAGVSYAFGPRRCP